MAAAHTDPAPLSRVPILPRAKGPWLNFGLRQISATFRTAAGGSGAPNVFQKGRFLRLKIASLGRRQSGSDVDHPSLIPCFLVARHRWSETDHTAFVVGEAGGSGSRFARAECMAASVASLYGLGGQALTTCSLYRSIEAHSAHSGWDPPSLLMAWISSIKISSNVAPVCHQNRDRSMNRESQNRSGKWATPD